MVIASAGERYRLGRPPDCERSHVASYVTSVSVHVNGCLIVLPEFLSLSPWDLLSCGSLHGSGSVAVAGERVSGHERDLAQKRCGRVWAQHETQGWGNFCKLIGRPVPQNTESLLRGQ